MRYAQALRRIVTVALAVTAFVCQETWALAGVTGGISGYIHDTGGAPVANASVTVVSPSEQTSAKTDQSGHFSFLTLSPDTYTISAAKEGYQDTSIAGVTVFADQVQTVSLTMPQTLRTIASVRTQSAGSLVKSGVGGDIYNVDPSQIAKTTTLGGGGNLNSAYGAIASVPGLVVGTGNAGWNQAVSVRGANPFTTGFEYDGIPVNRAFDNYTASTASNLGLQELQVYTGGGPSSISSAGISGFINQVIKTGTYPGYGFLEGGIGTEAFYHSLRVEAGGASPSRNFSYYVGLSGYNQDYRYFDNNNGASLMTPGGVFGTYGTLTVNGIDGTGVLNVCPVGGVVDPADPPQGCVPQTYGLFALQAENTDRENVVNLHFGFPRKNGQRDDLQLMWSASALRQLYNSAPDKSDLNQFMINLTGLPYCNAANTSPGCASTAAFFGGPLANYPFYMDAFTYNIPFGTAIAGHAPGVYFEPNTPTHRAPFAPQPLADDDLTNNDTGIVKAQITHPFNSTSFLRLMGYTFFSDWTNFGPETGLSYDVAFAAINGPNYDLITHTGGGMLQYFNQVNDKHLLQFTGNYTHADVARFNNTGFLSPSYLDLFGCPQIAFGVACAKSSPIGYVSRDASGAYHCWDPVGGGEVSCLNVYNDTLGLRSYGAAIAAANGLAPTAANGALFFVSPTRAGGSNAFVGPFSTAPPGSPAALANAQWVSLWDGNASGTFNSVKPDFYSAALADQWRPSDKLTINASIRFDRFQYGLADANTGQNPFYAQIINQFLCFNPTTNLPDLAPLVPGVFPPPAPNFEATCPSGFFHPGSGGVPTFSLTNFPKTYGLNYWEPRISGTFSQNPDTVWRFSAGRYAQPPLSASVEYLYRGGAASSLWSNFTELGFWTPFHPIPGQTSAQYDLSLEKRLHGTAMSFKLTPFYGTTSSWQQQSFIGAGFVTQIPVGRARSWGVEAQFNYGDFNRQGLSGLLSLTYTKAQVQFQNLMGQNQIHLLNEVIDNYNAMTRGPKCFQNGAADPGCTDIDGTGTGSVILNPYAGLAAQGHLDENGWYPQGLLALAPGGVNGNPDFYGSPFAVNLVANWRARKFALTPSLQLQTGAAYGSPLQTPGVDPTVCAQNQAATHAVAPTAPTALNCDYTTMTQVGGQPNFGYLYIPNPQTGAFTNVGQYTQPTITMLNLQASYDVSPRVTLQLTATDIWHTCFGGSSTPWSKAFPPGQSWCGYGQDFFYTSNFYNGAAPTDASANHGITPYPWMLQSYAPNNGVFGGGITTTYFPFNLYLQAQIKL